MCKVHRGKKYIRRIPNRYHTISYPEENPILTPIISRVLGPVPLPREPDATI